MVQLCSLCGRGFANHAAWTNHRQKVHPEVGSQINPANDENCVSQTFEVVDFEVDSFLQAETSEDEFEPNDFIFNWSVDSDDEQNNDSEEEEGQGEEGIEGDPILYTVP